MKNILILLVLFACSAPLKVENSGTVVIKHQNFIILYDTVNLCPVWSEYILTKNQVKPPKRGVFVCDDLLPCRLQQGNEIYKKVNYWIKSQLAIGKDYSLDLSKVIQENYTYKLAIGKDYSLDRGHLSDYDDLGPESMIFTNISFQNSYFNQNQWVSLENHVRQLALQNDTLIVRTGVIFKDSTIDGINIPVFYWKRVIIKATGDTLYWQMPNRYDDLDYSNYRQ
jgi:DNA/RNA endonuclease G (NUC1)